MTELLKYERSWGLTKARKDYERGNYEKALEHVEHVIAKANQRGAVPGPEVLKLRDDAARAVEEMRRRDSARHIIPVHDENDDDEEEDKIIVVQGPDFPDPQELPVYTPAEWNVDVHRKQKAVAVPRATEKVKEELDLPVYGQVTVADAAKEAAKEREETQDEIEKLRESVLYQRGPVGFQNRAGENNCFLNVVLQSLFLLPPFATEFVPATKHAHDERCCVFCALKGIFCDYQFGESSVIPPTAMRRALSVLYAPESRFALHAREDANEALEGILGELHAELTGHRGTAAANDAPCRPPCLVHRVFGLELVQQDVCAACGARSPPLTTREWVLYSPVESVVVEYRRTGSLERSIAHALAEHAVSCPGAGSAQCVGQTANRTKTLRTPPPVLSLGFVWPSTTPASATSRAFVDSLDLMLDVNQLFPSDSPASAAGDGAAAGEGREGGSVYVLRGIICFYGRHYVLFFMDRDKHHTDHHAKKWWFFDDSAVRPVGPWDALQPFIKQNSFHPTILFYTKL